MRAPSLYHYFPSKIAIYDALFQLGFRLYAEHTAEATRAVLSWQDEVRLNCEAYMTFAQQNPELYQLCFERLVPGLIPSAESLQLSLGLHKHAYSRFSQWQAGMDTQLSTEQVVNPLIVLMHGITAQHMANEPQLLPGQGRFGA